MPGSLGGLRQMKSQWDACDTIPAAPLCPLSPSRVSAGAAHTACAGLALFPSTTTQPLFISPTCNTFQEEGEVQHKGMRVQDSRSRQGTPFPSSLFLSLPAQGFVNPLPTPSLSWITALSPTEICTVSSLH